MPQQPSPPYASGALTIPRTLVRWDDVNAQNGPLQRTKGFVTLEAFTQPSSWNGYSDIVVAFNYEAPNNFALKRFTPPVSPNYVLCISFRACGLITRYLLWDAVGSNLNQTIPAYSGQVIRGDFRLEVWNTSQGVTSQSTAVTFYTSVMGGQDYRYGVDFELAPSSEVVEFSTILREIDVLPLAGLRYHWLSTENFSADGGNHFLSWLDTVEGVSLVPVDVGTVAALVYPPISQPSVITPPGTLVTCFDVASTSGVLAIAFLLNDLSTTGNIFDGNGGMILGFNATTQKLTAFTGGQQSNVTVESNKWYLAVIYHHSGQTQLYELDTQVLVDTWSGNAGFFSGPCTLGGTYVTVPEIVIYDQDITNPSTVSQLVGYFALRYFPDVYFSQPYPGEGSLPLVFPAGSTSTDNQCLVGYQTYPSITTPVPVPPVVPWVPPPGLLTESGLNIQTESSVNILPE